MTGRIMFMVSAFVLCAMMTACEDGGGDGDAGGSGQSGPWVGNWVQVNFLGTDDGGVWDGDDLSGIGFVAEITTTRWIETDEYGHGGRAEYSYTVDGNNRYSKHYAGGSAPGENESGRLEFSSDNRFMFEYFDLESGDTLAAFKWMRQ